MGINQQRIPQITNNANFGNIGNLLVHGHDMEYLARYYDMDIALVWALRLAGDPISLLGHRGWGLAYNQKTGSDLF